MPASVTGGAAVQRTSVPATNRSGILNLRSARAAPTPQAAPVSTVVATVDKAGLYKHVEASMAQCAAKYFSSAAFSKDLVKAFAGRDFSKEFGAATAKMLQHPTKKFQDDVKKVAGDGASSAIAKATAPSMAKFEKVCFVFFERYRLRVEFYSRGQATFSLPWVETDNPSLAPSTWAITHESTIVLPATLLLA